MTPFEEASKRWFDDPEFKARVSVVQRELQILGADRMSATNAIAVALVVDERARDDIKSRQAQTIDTWGEQAAMDLLRMAGWEVREDMAIGQLLESGEFSIVMSAVGYDPANRTYRRWCAQQKWRDVTDG